MYMHEFWIWDSSSRFSNDSIWLLCHIYIQCIVDSNDRCTEHASESIIKSSPHTTTSLPDQLSATTGGYSTLRYSSILQSSVLARSIKWLRVPIPYLSRINAASHNLWYITIDVKWAFIPGLVNNDGMCTWLSQKPATSNASSTWKVNKYSRELRWSPISKQVALT